MKTLITINNQQIERLEYKGRPVITLPMVDQLHERPEDTAGRNFRKHRKRFIKGEDYFNVPYKEWSQILNRRISSVQNSPENKGNSGSTNFVEPETSRKNGHRGSMIFLTESGYLMLTKPFQDDLAWAVQRQLVNRYFRMPDIDIVHQELTRRLRILCRDNAFLRKLNNEQGDMIRYWRSKANALMPKRKAYKPVSSEERMLIRHLTSQGYGPKEVAQMSGRSVRTVKRILQKALNA